jgi:SAM-dependent methyltransferase
MSTINVYNRMAADYVTMTKGHAPQELTDFITALRPKGRVLDLGCGPGHHAAEMAAAGLTVLAVDGSAEMVALASQWPGVTARQALFDDIPDLGPTDGIWASFSLLHAPRADMPRHLAALHALCTPNAPISLGMKLGTGERTDRLGRFYSYYTEDDLNMLLTQAGFSPKSALHGAGKGLAGDVEDWIVITAHA